jgi:predicted Zn-dependent protease
VDLTHKDIHHLHAAEGWLDLGMQVEAFNELEEIEPLNRAHPEVLLLRSRIYLAANKPDCAHTILATYTKELPDSPDGWFFLACSLSKQREVEKAEQALKKCFLAAAKTDDEKLWSDRAICTKDLDALWCSNQMSL